MSVNQARVERTQGQLGKPSRSGSSGQQRGFIGGSSGGGKGGGGGGSAPPLAVPTSAFTSAASPSWISTSLSTNRSFKKSGNGNGHGVQSRVNSASANSEAGASASATTTAQRVVQNGALDPVPCAEPTGGTKLVEMPMPRNAPRAIPRAPASQSATGATNSQMPLAMPKGDTSRNFTLQFGTINPGLVNGLQIPARTSSAPPNLDEQKHDQVHAEVYRDAPVVPIPSVPKQQHQQTRKDAGVPNQATSADLHYVTQLKRDVSAPVPSSTVVAPPKSSLLPISGMSVPMAIPCQPQQPQVPPQFGGPSSQLQPPGLVANSMQMTITIPVGNSPQVAQQIFFPGVQPHFVQQQAIMHQGQGLGYAPPISHQFPPQLGNMGMGISSQFPQQQPGKHFGPCKTTVKITHPETREELRLDKRSDSFKDGVSSGLRPQSQPISTYTAPHQMSFYTAMQQNSYVPTPLVFPTSLPLTSGQVPTCSQAQRYSYPVTQSGQHLSFTNSSMANTIPSGKPVVSTTSRGISEGVNLEGLPVSVSISIPAPVQITAKPTVTISMPVNKAEVTKPPKTVADAIASYQRSKVTPDGPVEKIKSGSEPLAGGLLPVTDTSSSAAAPLLPTQRVLPQALSAPKITSVDIRPDLFRSDDKKPADPLKNNEKNESREDLRNSQQHQLDASSSEGVRLSLLRTAEGSFARVPTTQEGCTKAENIGLASDLVTPSTCPSLKAESKVIPEIGSNEPFESKEIPAASGLSGLEKEKSEEACLGHNSLCLPTDGVSFKKGVPSEATTSLGAVVGGTSSKSLGTNSSTISRDLDARRVEMLDDSDQSETSNVSSQDSNEAKVHPSPSIAKSSVLADPIILLKQDDDVDEKVKFSKNAEIEKKLFSPKEDIRRINKQNGTVASLEITAVDCDIPSVDDVKYSYDMTKCERLYSKDNSLNDSCLIPETAAEPNPSASLIAQKLESEVLDLPSDGVVSVTSFGQKKPSLEKLKPRITAGKKKKRKEMLSKADAAGTSDLYNAFKGPEEKPDVVSKLKSLGSPTADRKMPQVDYPDKDVAASKEDGQNKADLDDWENAADILTPKLKTPQHGQLVDGARKQDDEVSYETSSPKKYSRDFLITLSQQFVKLPVGFAVGSDIADALMSSPLAKSPYSSPGRIIDQPSGASRVDRRMASNLDDDRWTRSPVSSGHGRDGRLDVGYGAANINLRPGQGVGHVVLKNPRGQASNQFGSGILSGPMQSLASQGGMPRGGPDVDRWQRARGLIPYPQTPMQVMHKAEQKYEVGKVTDEKQAKQRKLKAILNKLTPQNFDKLFAEVKEVNIDNAVTLTGVISQIFDKALMEPTFCEMYANFCFHLSGVLPDFCEDNVKITFKRLLLNKCQEEFERGEIEQAEADKAEEEGEIKQSREEREEKRLRARRRMLGNIRLIGELYKKKMLTERIMHECIQKLLRHYQNPDEEDIEALCKLMSTIGEIIDHPKAKEHMDTYFDMMTKLSTNHKLSSRVRFMLRDAIDLRRNKWQQRRKVEGPKKIEEVHRDAVQERQNQSSRLGRGPVISNVPRRGQAVDYGSRGPTASSSPNSQLGGGLRGVPSQARGYGNQDVRSEDRHQFETRTMSLPLSQRSDDDNITLGPQGGLARGMSFRGHLSGSNAPAAEISSAVGDHRRMIAAPNGSNYLAYQVSGTTHGQVSPREGNNYLGSREKMPDHAYERSITSSLSVGRTQGTSGGSLAALSEPRTLPEEVLQEKSISVIREFYSAKDENEVVLCIKELNAPSFYPSIISLWVTDSFERKDMERDLLSKLIINLCKSSDGLLNQVQLLQGFELVLSSLEDAMNDAPKAAEFLGRTFAKAVMENLVPLCDLGRLLREGGEEPGRLREIGLAAEVLGNILETIKSERGGTVLNEIQTNSNLQLEDFRPLHAMKSKLEAFL